MNPFARIGRPLATLTLVVTPIYAAMDATVGVPGYLDRLGIVTAARAEQADVFKTKLGEQVVGITTRTTGGELTIGFIHGDEPWAWLAGDRLSKEFASKFVAIQGKTRAIGGADPNRTHSYPKVSSVRGKKLPANSGDFSKDFTGLFLPGKPVLMLHNFGPGYLNAFLPPKGSLGKSAEKIFVPDEAGKNIIQDGKVVGDPRDRRNVVFVSTRELFKAVAALRKYNVVLEGFKDEDDDGSLTYWARRSKTPYINIDFGAGIRRDPDLVRTEPSKSDNARAEEQAEIARKVIPILLGKPSKP